MKTIKHGQVIFDFDFRNRNKVVDKMHNFPIIASIFMVHKLYFTFKK